MGGRQQQQQRRGHQGRPPDAPDVPRVRGDAAPDGAVAVHAALEAPRRRLLGPLAGEEPLDAALNAQHLRARRQVGRQVGLWGVCDHRSFR